MLLTMWRSKRGRGKDWRQETILGTVAETTVEQ